jgi:Tfp pilus assembly protein PilX
MKMKAIRFFVRIPNNDQGSALLISLIILLVLFLIGEAALKVASIETNISGNDVAAKQAFQAAEAASEYEAAQLRSFLSTSLAWSPSTSTINSSISTPSIAGYTIQEASPIALVAGSQQTKNATGTYSGLTAWTQSFVITTTANATTGRGKATVVRMVEDQLIPLFQFAVFYNGNLEVLPGANMTIGGVNGRIHSNSDIYLAADGSATLTINDRITTAGKLHHGTLDGRSLSQPVVITDGQGATPQLNLDSLSDPSWESNATSTWHGNVQTDVHGITPLNVPIPATTDYIEMIKQGPAADTFRYSNQAGLKIIDGVATDKNGTTVNLTTCAGGNPVSTASFFDKRENRTVTVRQVDVAKLQLCTAARNAVNNPPSGADAGILYVSETTAAGDSSKAVRLINGSVLDSSNLPNGLMVATDNPLYIKGDYNSANRPAAIAADAVMIQSNNWNDANGNQSQSSGLRDASASDTVNAAIMAGNVKTNGSNYSGGLENFPRFMENWGSSRTFNFSGSWVCLWESRKAIARWNGQPDVYTPPTRVWNYGININNLPPGTPRVRNLQRIQWYQKRN